MELGFLSRVLRRMCPFEELANCELKFAFVDAPTHILPRRQSGSGAEAGEVPTLFTCAQAAGIVLEQFSTVYIVVDMA